MILNACVLCVNYLGNTVRYERGKTHDVDKLAHTMLLSTPLSFFLSYHLVHTVGSSQRVCAYFPASGKPCF